MNEEIRVRFAPSPTGHLHIGGLRTALFNYLFAKHHGGKYLVRIEDTDTDRSKQEYTDAILDSLSWTQLESDEKIVTQSERIEEHKKILQKLIDEGKAYKCYCTQDEVVSRHEIKTEDDFYVKYDGFCKNRKDRPENKSFVVRFALPKDQEEIVWQDLIRGRVAIHMDQLDDFIIARSDGRPMYNFVVVIDDAHMRISHVIRGEDHISNTPKQLLLYKACGFDVPEFAHIPLILGPSGDRLSKRDGATSVLEYRQAGYLPDAFLNYLVRLGWSHGDQEIFTRKELIDYFSLDHVGKKGSIFDREKLNWVNSQYLEKTDALDLCNYIINQKMLDIKNQDIFIRAIELYKTRVKTIKELIDVIVHMCDGPQGAYNKDDIQKFMSENTPQIFDDILKLLQTIDVFDKDSISYAIKNYAKEEEIKFVFIGQPLRIALIGSSNGPGVFDLMQLLEKDCVCERVEQCKNYLKETMELRHDKKEM